jgi:hypothetical protein
MSIVLKFSEFVNEKKKEKEEKEVEKKEKDEKGEKEENPTGLTAKQKKLPEALQKSILKKQKKSSKK